MKYGKYLETRRKEEWKEHYLDYKGLKDLIKVRAFLSSSVHLSSIAPCHRSLVLYRAPTV